MGLITTIDDPAVIHRILTHFGLPGTWDGPQPAPSAAAPRAEQPVLPFGALWGVAGPAANGNPLPGPRLALRLTAPSSGWTIRLDDPVGRSGWAIRFDLSHALWHARRTMAGRPSALCQADRPRPTPAVTENWLSVIYALDSSEDAHP